MSPEKMSKRQERRAKMQRQQQRQRLILIGLIVLGAALVVFAVVWPQIRPAGEVVTVNPTDLPNPNGTSLGDANAAVTIDVFVDFQCPACKSFTENIEPLVFQNLVATGKARYVFHNYSFLDGNGAGNGGESDQAANAAMCANEQGKFWEMHATLYANSEENQGAFRTNNLQAMAQNVGLDMKAFNSCFQANKYKVDIQADFDLGQKMGVSGTPTVFVNGKQAGKPGFIATYDDIAQAVEQASGK